MDKRNKKRGQISREWSSSFASLGTWNQRLEGLARNYDVCDLPICETVKGTKARIIVSYITSRESFIRWKKEDCLVSDNNKSSTRLCRSTCYICVPLRSIRALSYYEKKKKSNYPWSKTFDLLQDDWKSWKSRRKEINLFCFVFFFLSGSTIRSRRDRLNSNKVWEKKGDEKKMRSEDLYKRKSKGRRILFHTHTITCNTCINE